MKKILILLKKSENYGDYNDSGKPKAGLYNSAFFLYNALRKITSVNLELCIDGNDIDNKIFKHKPDVCIIQAIWVTPNKIKELKNLYPNLKFIIMIHSKIPFLAMEGVAISWIKEYNEIDNVEVGVNNFETSVDLNSIGIKNNYLPNLYKMIFKKYKYNFYKFLFFTKFKPKKEYNIGCFGAIRPMKNHLNQAVAAINFANQNNATLNFYVNAGRVEQKGENVLKNLIALFKDTKHNLIEVGWLDRIDFLQLLSTMDLSMQVSLTESFNIVAADSVLMEVPLVVSSEISWLSNGIADPNDVNSMICQMYKVLNNKKKYIRQNLISLIRYNNKAFKIWLNEIK